MIESESGSRTPREIKVAFVSVESGLTALGFRRVAAIARKLQPSTDIYFVAVDNLYSVLSTIFPSKAKGFSIRDGEIAGQKLAAYDLICFSSMSASAKEVELIITSIRKHNPKAFVLFGGVHAILYPNEAMAVADAICIAEGEKAYEKFYRAFIHGDDFTTTSGMWFKDAGGKIRKNTAPPLNTNQDLSEFPHLYYGTDCEIYDLQQHRFRPFSKFDQTRYNGLAYRTVWSIGCPFTCSFCANDAFIAQDKAYVKLRYPSPEYLIREIEEGLKSHPYTSTVAFYDDNLIALPLETIREFSQKYKERIGLPFVVFGIHPNTIRQEKIDLLAEAGMNRTRMGIQSGSEKMLKFYDRGTPVARIHASAAILAKAAIKHNMIPPAYDIISDNPLELREDVADTLRFLFDLERPFTLTIFGLRIFPNTKLWQYFTIHNEWGDPRKLNSSYLDTRKTMGNVLLYILATGKPPRRVFDFLLQFVRGYDEKQPQYPVLHFLAKTIYLSKRAVDHLLRLDFTVIVGRWTYFLWRMGLVGRRRLAAAPVREEPTIN